MKTVDDAIESLLSHYRKQVMAFGDQEKEVRDFLLQKLDEAAIFFMGEAHDLADNIKAVAGDLKKDMDAQIPMPFDSMLIVYRNTDVEWTEKQERISEEQLRRHMVAATMTTWMGSFVVKMPVHFFERDLVLDGMKNTRLPVLNEDQLYFVSDACFADFRKYEPDSKPGWHSSIVMFVEIRTSGTEQGRMFGDKNIDSLALQVHYISLRGWDMISAGAEARGNTEVRQFTELVGTMLDEIVLISHPMNYIVRETPALTPREARRASRDRVTPDRKKPRYIVIDHDVLVQLSRGNTPDEAERRAHPIAHARRGHWKRLAERCVHARERGIDRVWVRPTYVGAREFVHGDRRYQVLLDFNVKRELV